MDLIVVTFGDFLVVSTSGRQRYVVRVKNISIHPSICRSTCIVQIGNSDIFCFFLDIVDYLNGIIYNNVVSEHPLFPLYITTL